MPTLRMMKNFNTIIMQPLITKIKALQVCKQQQEPQAIKLCLHL